MIDRDPPVPRSSIPATLSRSVWRTWDGQTNYVLCPRISLVVASDNDFITQDGSMQGNAYKDSSGANIDSVVLVYRISLPEGMKPL